MRWTSASYRQIASLEMVIDHTQYMYYLVSDVRKLMKPSMPIQYSEM